MTLTIMTEGLLNHLDDTVNYTPIQKSFFRLTVA